ncbi:tRNA-dihydrouridine synthase [Alcanivorax borkumensis]|jgi:tRNA-dihydrouridine synthase C|uniref:tRNA-dihydrouridine(16) synthase n=3 Tax=Alcanivorax TaxID=59753 RepID=Q0VMI8_ALCBS|nr:tRNA-dihydrouridine synthase [Alcanivorax borkumensis]CAL17610.1 Dihydrouridine synthase protein family, putative [Alcanivorax borkumensis SK2]
MRAMKLILAPMEGLADFWVRQALTDVGDYDWCVSEFVRVSGLLLPPKVFYRWCPELKLGARTRAGTPVHLQLLGSDPACMADNAERAVELGAPAIDLNFGCPAKTVNRHRGGAVLLDEPDVVHAVTAAVRQAVPSQVPVSVKMRLGNEDDARALDNARAVVDAGAAWLTVHGRTKRQGYKPPAFWDRIGHIREVVSIPVIANGEIWTPDDAGRAQRESGCEDLMLGRGAVANPLLVSLLRFGGETNWDAILPILQQFWMDVADTGTDAQLAGRIKQWLSYLRRRWPQAAQLLEQVKRETSPGVIGRLLADFEPQ